MASSRASHKTIRPGPFARTVECLQKTLHPSDGEQSPSTRLLDNGHLDPMAIVVHLSLTAGQRSEKVKR